MRTRLWTLLFVVTLLAGLTLASCGPGSSGPQAGTPQWYWQSAQETYAAGDYEKAQANLEQVAKSDSENKDQAALWRATLSAGLARGYMELGNTLEEVVKHDSSLAGDFTVRIQDYRRDARRHAISFTESIGMLRKIAEAQPAIKLQFPFPAGSANEAPALVSLKKGEKVPPPQIDAAVGYTLKRGVLLQAAQMAGARGDATKAQAQFQSGAAEVPKLVFLQALGKSLYDVSALFSKDQLNEPKIQKVMLESALQCLGPALETEDAALKKQTEEIKKEIDKEAAKSKA
jgi:hypothetical protein